MSPLKLAFLNLSRRKVPSVIAVISIAVSIACSGILLRLNLVSENRFSTFGRGGDAIVGAKASGIEIILGALNGEGEYPGFLPYVLFESLRAEQTLRFEDGVQVKPSYTKSIIPFVFFARFDGYRIVGTDESFVTRPAEVDSLKFASGSWSSALNEVVLGANVAKKKGLKSGDIFVAQTWAGDAKSSSLAPSLSFKVSGVFEPTNSAWDRMLFSNVQTAHQALMSMDIQKKSIWGPRVLNYFLIYLEPNGFDGVSSLVNHRTVGQAVLVTNEKTKLEKLTGVGTKLGLFVTVLILTLGGLSVASMLITRFDSMSLQLAVLRALGYKKKTIGKWLLWEGFLLGVAACFVGGAFDLVGFPIVRSLLGDALPPTDIVTSSIFQSLPIWGTAVIATTVSVFIPLYRVYHQDIHFSLRN